MKNDDQPMEVLDQAPSVARLTEANLKKQDIQMDTVPKPSAPSSKKPKKGAAKPAWAMTEKQEAAHEEAEIDDLLEFAYELDYEKYMEDLEVRQALAVIKERVKDMKQDQDWKQKIANEWNAAN
jgi:hypothetical protein